MTTAIVLIRCKRRAIASAGRALAEAAGVAEVYSVGGRFDLVAIVRVPTEDDLAELMTERLIGVEGILETETLVAFRAYSPTDLGMGFGLGFQEGQQR